MQAISDIELLREYATRGSETAFETVVSRHVRFVFSAALRQVRDPHLAEEISQAVFIILAKKAGRIHEKTVLSGWLFKTTRFVALAQTRAAARRHQYETEVQLQSETHPHEPDPLWQQMSPLLDEALAQLGQKDRQAVLLRFFENKSLGEVGGSLGTGEDTARMRINRALEKLRRYFLKRGVRFYGGGYRGSYFRQFGSRRAADVGEINHCGCNDEGCCSQQFNINPHQRSIETYGMDKNQNCRRSWPWRVISCRRWCGSLRNPRKRAGGLFSKKLLGSQRICHARGHH